MLISPINGDDVMAVLVRRTTNADMKKLASKTRALKCKPSAGDMIIKKPEE